MSFTPLRRIVRRLLPGLSALALLGAGCSITTQLPPPSPSAAPAPRTPPPGGPDPAAEAKAPTAPPAPPTHTVNKGTLKRSVQLDAVVESAEMHPLRIAPRTWMDWTVLEAVAHGAAVKAGDVLVRVDTEKIREQIEDLEQDRPNAVAALKLAEAELANLEGATPQRLDAARRGSRNADQDLAYFDKVGRERRQKTAEMNLRGSQQNLENTAEELKQLEKMYKSDDLTEETEEIVLKRQRFAVEQAQFYLESTRLNAERELKIALPREDENLRAAQRDQQLALTLAEATLPTALEKKRMDVEKLRRDQKKAQKRLTELQADLAAMSIRAPIDGLVYYGACENGRWPTGAMIAKKLIPGGKLMPQEVFMTVLAPGKLQLHATTPESEVARLPAGLAGEAVPTSQPARRIPVKIERIDPFPAATGGFDTLLGLPAAGAAGLAPGMTCKVTLIPPARPEAVLAPSSAVFTEAGESFVFIARSGVAPERRVVRTGESDGKSIEILEGLRDGDKILQKRPE